MVIMGSSVPRRVARLQPAWRKCMPMTRRPASTIVFIGLSATNTIGYYAQGRYAEAEPRFQRALALREKALGPEHPLVATSLHNLAGLYRAQGRYAEAEPRFQRALII